MSRALFALMTTVTAPELGGGARGTFMDRPYNCDLRRRSGTADYVPRNTACRWEATIRSSAARTRELSAAQHRERRRYCESPHGARALYSRGLQPPPVRVRPSQGRS